MESPPVVGVGQEGLAAEQEIEGPRPVRPFFRRRREQIAPETVEAENGGQVQSRNSSERERAPWK